VPVGGEKNNGRTASGEGRSGLFREKKRSLKKKKKNKESELGVVYNPLLLAYLFETRKSKEMRTHHKSPSYTP
jgi:hypothetical protein